MTNGQSIAIVGAGLAGLGMALSLHSQGIKSTIYEASPPDERFGGGIMLSPNALRILDQLNIYKKIRPEGWNFETVHFVDLQGTVTDQQYLGSEEVYGYKALRIYRNTILPILKDACAERGITINYTKKVTSIVNETESDVTIRFADGSEATHTIVIAADGIHSKIRSILLPDLTTKYTGILVVGGAASSSSFAPTNVSLKQPVSEAAPPGQSMFLIAPQNPDGTDFLVGTQRLHPEETREGWERIAEDREFHRKFLLDGVELRSPLMQSAARGVTDESIYTWPFYVVPPLPRWYSDKGRIVIIGDAAHAIPPTMGQGGNQAFEDGYSLALIIGRTKDLVGEGWQERLSKWDQGRKERIGRLLVATQKMNNARMPRPIKDKLPKDQIWDGSGGVEAVRWIFEPNLEEWVNGIVAE